MGTPPSSPSSTTIETMSKRLSVTIARMQAKEPWRSYSDIAAELGRRAAEKRKRKKPAVKLASNSDYWWNDR